MSSSTPQSPTPTPQSHATRPSRVVFNRRVGPGWYTLRLEEATIAQVSRAGQFVQVKTADRSSFDPLLRRPFSVYDVDRERGTYDLLYTAVGRGTRWLADIPDSPGTMVEVEGPFGNTFTAPTDRDSIYLVGGGVGVAPLYLFARELLASRSALPRITLCMGARTREQLQGIDEFRRLSLRCEVATDDGSEGFHGRVTQLFATLAERDREPLRVYGCGPQGMNESLRAIAVERSYPTEICVESLMACGFGVCFGCVLPIRKKPGGDFYNRRTCYEGPVFDARLLHPGIE